MEEGLLTALSLVSLGGILTGAFAFPMARMRRWNWENIWLMYAFFGLLVIPTAVVSISVPDLWKVYQEVEPSRVLLIVFIGYLWGWGSTTFGLGVDRLGMSLAFALILGISTFVGALVPWVLASDTSVRIGFFLLGLIVLVIGMGLCGVAGHWREQQQESADSGKASEQYTTGVFICAISGILSSFLNVGVSLAQPVQEIARLQAASEWASGNVFWPMLLFGGFLGNLTYCGYRIRKNKSFSRFFSGGLREWGGALFMGAAWISGVFLYGLAAYRLGSQGPVLGWPVFMSFIVLCAYALGFLSGEWKGAQRRAIRWMSGGIALMVASLFLITRSG